MKPGIVVRKPPSSPTSAKPDDPAQAAGRQVEGDEETIIMPAGARLPGRKSGPVLGEISAHDLLQCLSDGVVVADATGSFREFNPAAVAILGKGAVNEPAENWPKTYGLFLPNMTTLFPHDQLPLVRALRGETTQEVEMYVRNKHVPEGKWLRVRGSPIFDAHGRQIGAAAVFRDDTERKQAEQALNAERRFLRHLIQTQDRDRQLTAFDMHDGLVQLMTGALMRLEAHRGKPAGTAAEDLKTAENLLRDAIDEARRMIGGLRPPEIDEKGVVGAIEYLAAPRNGGKLKIVFVHDAPFARLSALQETTIFRIVQEALHNVERHSGSDRARVVLQRSGDTIYLEIRDWGKGFDTTTTRMRRFGLRGIEERSRLLGGTAQIESSPKQGTVIRVTLPLDAASSQEVTETES